MTPFQKFCVKWGKGCGSSLCAGASEICLARGTVPCGVLLVGEAPGEAENRLGVPFAGPAGHLLDHIISQSIPPGVSYALTNLVGCLPRDEEGGKALAPEEADIQCCAERLAEFVELCNPRLLVCVGNLARDYLEPGYRHSIKLKRFIPQIYIVHPAFILRSNVARKASDVKRCVVQIRNAVAEMLETDKEQEHAVSGL